MTTLVSDIQRHLSSLAIFFFPPKLFSIDAAKERCPFVLFHFYKKLKVKAEMFIGTGKEKYCPPATYTRTNLFDEFVLVLKG